MTCSGYKISMRQTNNQYILHTTPEPHIAHQHYIVGVSAYSFVGILV